MAISVSVAPQIFQVGPIAVTNTMITTVLISVLLIIFLVAMRKKMSFIPTRAQVFFEALYEYFSEQTAPMFGNDKKRVRQLTALVSTSFLFLFLVNQFSLIPLLSQITLGEAPLFRTPPTDLNLPFAMAFFLIGWSHYISFTSSPLNHISKFINYQAFLKIRKPADIGTAFIEFFLGLLDIVGEVSKILSLSFRLFGNMLAGELIILIISGISMYTTYIVPIPFIVLSTFSGIVQAFVFSILCLNFVGGMVPPSREFRKSEQAVEPALSVN